jgi:hypothetical protein
LVLVVGPLATVDHLGSHTAALVHRYENSRRESPELITVPLQVQGPRHETRQRVRLIVAEAHPRTAGTKVLSGTHLPPSLAMPPHTPDGRFASYSVARR